MAEVPEDAVVAAPNAAEIRLRAILAGMLDPVVTIDAHGTVLEASASVLPVFGWQPDELIGRNVRELMGEPHRSLHDGYLARYRETGATHILGRTREFEIVRKDGTPLCCELSVSRVDVPGEAQPLFVGSFRDVSARREVERREMQMLKSLAAIGESASVLAHEIKNPITGIRFAIRAVADHLGEDDRDILRGLEASLQKVERTMRRTLSFARPLELARRPLEPRHLLGDVAQRARAELPHSRAELEIECDSSVASILADPELLGEALLNLARNALEALGPGGRMRLSACLEGGMLELSVEDDGPGLPVYVGANVFKPFYTTKELGTGIGLALCKKIAEAHGGSIRAGRSALGGAAFTIRLPLA
jgi:two-component system sensor kinase FixL